MKNENIQKVSLRRQRSVSTERYGDIIFYNITAKDYIDKYNDVFEIVARYMDDYNARLKEDENTILDIYSMIIEITPIVTNLDFEDMTDDEIEDIFVNPNMNLAKVIGRITELITGVMLPQLQATLEAITNNPDLLKEFDEHNGLALSKRGNRLEAKKSMQQEKEDITKNELVDIEKQIAELKAKYEQLSNS